MEKLTFVNPDAEVFAGKRILDNLKAKSFHTGMKDLLLTLECFALNEQPKQCFAYLDRYIKSFHQTSSLAHPLALVALARLSSFTSTNSAVFLQAFAEMYPLSIDVWLTVEEKQLILEDKAREGNESPLGPRNNADETKIMWEGLKEQNLDCKSEAMDSLLKLTGLKKVKIAALNLFKTAIKFQRSSAKFRTANSMALNYCFVGNPGTGKTTVARLFAEILYDSKLRRKNTFVECTAQSAKDAGIDEFRKLCTSALDGVLFIDEAYDLDPLADFKGKPIVNELLTLSENKRDRISIILAGYEDDMNSKLFAYNTGLKSRFDSIMFDDFDQKELTSIWSQMRTERDWKEASTSLTEIAVRRLIKTANRKGFGNARAVRTVLEAATRNAMSRDDYDDSNPTLKILDVIGEDPSLNPKIKDVLNLLDSKIGWTEVKKAVKDLIVLCSDNYQRELRGEAPVGPFLNRLFLGNPGTGKTTCAAIYGQVLKYLGFLSEGDVVSKTAGDFCGSVIGEAQKKALSIIEGARGKVLVIDEAYNLDDNHYGKQVLDVLVEKVQGSESDNIAVLLLGYEEPILKMIKNQNPGLARRFPREQAFIFEDYSDKELVAIMKGSCSKFNADASLDFQEHAIRVLVRQKQLSNFGNAATVNQLVVSAMQKAKLRYQGSSKKIRLELCDIEADAGSIADPLAELDSLYCMEENKAKIQKIKDSFVVADREGSAPPDLGHFVFRGSPGTGKTTVARAIARVLFNLKLLTVNKLVETSGLGLTGNFVGQTKTIVKDKLDEARGGVLFIDEAYELGKGSFGAEACTSIVAAMTDPQYKGMVIIIAGYSCDIDAMLDTNLGLKSRFTHFFEFKDWKKSDCVDFISGKARKENYNLSSPCIEALQSGFAGLISRPGWGNGRDVDKLWKSVLEHRASRVVTVSEDEKTIALDDIAAAMSAMLVARGGDASGCSPSSDNPLAPLDRLYRMDGVKAKLELLRDAHIVAKREGGILPGLGHFAFTGSPGTGKTTVARVVAKVLYDLGLVSVNRLVETSGLKLTGEFIGQTKTKVEQQLIQARGGVLFIDEAYELGKGHFSDEACTSIVAAMTDPKYVDTVIIIAGYPAEIDSMLDTNVGLKSRFTQFFEFPDWNAADAVNYFLGKAKLEKFTVPEHAVSCSLEMGLLQLVALPGWGNGRDVERLWRDVLALRAKRVITAPENPRTIALCDVEPAVEEMLRNRLGKGKTPNNRSLLQIAGDASFSTDVHKDYSAAVSAYSPPPRSDSLETAKLSKMNLTLKAADEIDFEHLEDAFLYKNTLQAKTVPSKDTDLVELSQQDCIDKRDDGVHDDDWNTLMLSKAGFEQLEKYAEEFAQKEEEIKAREKNAEKEHEEHKAKIKKEVENQRQLEELRKIDEAILKLRLQEEHSRLKKPTLARAAA